MDNYGTHKHEKVEKWFGILARKALKRGSFDSVASLIGGIQAYMGVWNKHPKPFTWTKTSDEILAKAKGNTINHTLDT